MAKIFHPGSHYLSSSSILYVCFVLREGTITVYNEPKPATDFTWGNMFQKPFFHSLGLILFGKTQC